MPGRRLSHATGASPVVQNPQLPARGGPPSLPTGGGDGSGPAEDTPLYVNAKQFHRILKRRNARQKLEEALRLTSKARKPYLHESRHKHAMRRPRGPGGRFLTSDEVAAMEKKAAEDPSGQGGISEDSPNGDSNTPGGAGSKRKAGASSLSSTKKAKGEGAPAVKDPNSNVDEDDEEDYGEDDG
jgi:nuclear transcription factor Y, alpha